MINLGDKKCKETHSVSLFIEISTTVYFHSFGIEYISQEVLKKIRYKLTTHNIFTIQVGNSIMCGFCFIECILAGKLLLDYTNLFSPNDYKKMAKE